MINYITLDCLDSEIGSARRKFPANAMMLAALMEEVGELAKALLENRRNGDGSYHVFEEAIQVAAMAIRIAEEGSSEFPYRFQPSFIRRYKEDHWVSRYLDLPEQIREDEENIS